MAGNYDYYDNTTPARVCAILATIATGIAFLVHLLAPAFFVSHEIAYPENGYDYLFSGSTAIFGKGTYRIPGMETSASFSGTASTSALVFFLITLGVVILGVLCLIGFKKEMNPIILVAILFLCAVALVIGFFMNMQVVDEFVKANGYNPILTRHPLHYLVVATNILAIIGFAYPGISLVKYIIEYGI